MKRITYFHEVYLEGCSAVGGPLEKEGPIGKLFDLTFDDLYIGCTNYEHAEVMLLDEAYRCLIQKLNSNQFDLCVGGDLMNQMGVSNYFVRELHIPFIGVYAACSNSTLAMHVASTYLSTTNNQRSLVFTSSHYANAEKQFRYPNEYGIQKKETVTTTVTGAGCIALCNRKQAIKVVCGIIGEVVDANETDANDMGSAMVLACYTTITKFFENSSIAYEEIDFIYTGDLSTIGKSLLLEMLQPMYEDIDSKLDDCGTIIYDVNRQNVFSGGSGCACSMCTLNAYIVPKLLNKDYKRVLVVATGALLNPIMLQQKETIPCVAHGILLEHCL